MLSARFSSSMTSSTVFATAHARGEPPYVVPWERTECLVGDNDDNDHDNDDDGDDDDGDDDDTELDGVGDG